MGTSLGPSPPLLFFFSFLQKLLIFFFFSIFLKKKVSSFLFLVILFNMFYCWLLYQSLIVSSVVGAPWRCGVLTTQGGIAGIGLGRLLGGEHDSFNFPEWRGGSSPVKTEPPQIVLLLLLLWCCCGVVVVVVVVVVRTCSLIPCRPKPLLI